MTKILKVVAKAKYRMIVISDIHGGYHLFEDLLQKCNLKAEDYLIILGDFLQRGHYNIQVLEKMMALKIRPKTYILSGNHEHYLCSLLREENINKFIYHLEGVHYGCILRTWLEPFKLADKDYKKMQNYIRENYRQEIIFLENLPHVLEMDDHIFVHAGIEAGYDWKNSKIQSFLSMPEFLNHHHTAGKYVVVGHWPIQNYRLDSLSGDIIFDDEKKIIAIDGGYGVKSTGQMNALIINKDPKIKYDKKSVDAYLGVQVKADVSTGHNVKVKLDWHDRAYEIIERKAEFSWARKVSTGQEFLLKNEFILVEDTKYNLIDDYVSLFIQAKKGDFVSLIDYFGKYALVKHEGEVGWIKRTNLQE